MVQIKNKPFLIFYSALNFSKSKPFNNAFAGILFLPSNCNSEISIAPFEQPISKIPSTTLISPTFKEIASLGIEQLKNLVFSILPLSNSSKKHQAAG